MVKECTGQRVRLYVRGTILGFKSSIHGCTVRANECTSHNTVEKFKLIRANDDATVLDALSLSTPKIRLLRSLTVEKKNSVQDLQA
ncbi:hypothetical protein ZWY2020_042456 [Hordeum vulgare]|nr:hypothetical protein ZWY2020_042456 [Hordeum vulgare]